MSNVDATPETAKVTHAKLPPAEPYIDEAIQYDDIMRITQSLADLFSYEDITKMTFLFGDQLKKSDFQNLISREPNNFSKIKFLMEIVVKQLQLNWFLVYDVLLEMLYLTKKFKALRQYNTCRHQIKERFLKSGIYLSSEFRRFLLSVCDELTEDDVTYLWSRVQEGSSDVKPAQAELLFEWMLDAKQIDPKDVDKLSVHFQVMERNDLLDKLEKYKNKIGDTFAVNLYDLSCDLSCKSYGLALIFNFSTFLEEPRKCDQRIAVSHLSPRKGSDIDADKMEKVWKSFGIEVDRRTNITSPCMKQILKETLMKDLSCIKILIICIMSHGNNGVIYCSDGVPINISDIEELLGKSSSLANKPKLLFIQACQGTNVQEVGTSSNIADSYAFDSLEQSATAMVVPQFSDMLIGMATVPGFMSIRSTKEGTHYIQSLCDLLLEKGDKMDLTQLLVQVNFHVMNKSAVLRRDGKDHQLLQMPTIRNQLTKGLIFKRIPMQGSGIQSK